MRVDDKMSALSNTTLYDMCSNSILPLVGNMIEMKEQIQQEGIDLTLLKAERIIGAGYIDFDNSQRVIPEAEEVKFDDDGWMHLPFGVYRITFNEIVNVPNWACGYASCRSSLFRSGAFTVTAFWDAGYSGRSQCMLYVANPNGINLKRDAKMVQLVFLCLDKPVSKTYTGIFRDENLSEYEKRFVKQQAQKIIIA